MELRGAITLITGGASGLGEATARLLAQSGATVIVGDLRGRKATTVAGSICEAGGQAYAVRLDVADEQCVRDTVARIVEHHGRLDAVVNAAGVDVTAPAEELPGNEWRHIIGVNLDGPFWLAQAALPVMREQGSGHIVNVASTASKRAWCNASAYHASKWGLLGLSHALHAEARSYGVKVTAVISGGMRTPFLLERFPDIDPELLQEPTAVADTIRFALTQPAETVIPELMVLPMRETSWP